MKKKIDLYMPLKGTLMPIREINSYLPENTVDGLGVGIYPEEDIFYSPVTGKVVMVGEYHNMVAISVAEGVTILIQCGIHSEKLGGRGFSSYVREKDHVTTGDKLLFMDREYVSNRSDITTPVIISNRAGVEKIETDYTVTDAFVRFMEIHLK